MSQELRLRFLQCREGWLAELVAEVEGSAGGSPYDYLKRLTDVHRLHLFDVVMHYRAIFSDDSSAQVGPHLVHICLVMRCFFRGGRVPWQTAVAPGRPAACPPVHLKSHA